MDEISNCNSDCPSGVVPILGDSCDDIPNMHLACLEQIRGFIDLNNFVISIFPVSVVAQPVDHTLRSWVQAHVQTLF